MIRRVTAFLLRVAAGGPIRRYRVTRERNAFAFRRELLRGIMQSLHPKTDGGQ